MMMICFFFPLLDSDSRILGACMGLFLASSRAQAGGPLIPFCQQMITMTKQTETKQLLFRQQAVTTPAVPGWTREGPATYWPRWLYAARLEEGA